MESAYGDIQRAAQAGHRDRGETVQLAAITELTLQVATPAANIAADLECAGMKSTQINRRRRCQPAHGDSNRSDKSRAVADLSMTIRPPAK